MKTVALVLLLCASSLIAQQTPLAPNAPPDKPFTVESEKVAALHKAMEPFIAKARATYPEAKKRYLAGLPPRQVFFLVTRLRDQRGRMEQVFIEIQSIADGKASGILASDIRVVEGFKRGQAYTFPEKDLIDWLISKPDGTEEGNVVGIFLDNYKP